MDCKFQMRIANIDKDAPLLNTNVSTDAWCDELLKAIATHVVGNCPDRFEPRLRERCPKPYKHLRKHRRNYKRSAA